MSHQGEFSTHRREGSHVTKQATETHPAGSGFVAAMASTGHAGMRAYLHALRSTGVRLADDLRLVSTRPLAIRHRWMTGATLIDLTSTTSPTTFATAITEIAHWVRDLDDTDARIDTNLANFCLEAGRPVLIDVLPPLIPSLRPTPMTLFDELFAALCFDTPVILDALIGYALRQLLRITPAAAQALLPLDAEFPAGQLDAGFPALWFRARRILAIRAANGEADVARAQDFFALTSVLGFKQLSESGRKERIDTVARRLQEQR